LYQDDEARLTNTEFLDPLNSSELLRGKSTSWSTSVSEFKIEKKKVKISLLQAVESCERSRLPHFLDKQLTDGGKVVSPTRWPFTPQVSFLRFLVLISVRG
jgi:hypothetical protein